MYWGQGDDFNVAVVILLDAGDRVQAHRRVGLRPGGVILGIEGGEDEFFTPHILRGFVEHSVLDRLYLQFDLIGQVDLILGIPLGARIAGDTARGVGVVVVVGRGLGSGVAGGNRADTSDAPELTGASDTSDASETVPWVEAVDPVSLEDGLRLGRRKR